jgi:DNA polymerase III alpha subunit
MTNLWKSAAIPPLPQYSLYEKLWAELECLDLTVSSHLLTLYGVGEPDSSDCTLTLAGSVTAKKSWHRTVLPIVAARHLPRFDGKLVTLAGWLITAKRTRTAKHELMKFMTLEDPTASFEVTLFPKVYRRFGPLLYDRGPYIVRGRVEREGACCTLTALWLDRL